MIPLTTEEKLQHFLDTCMEDARTRSNRMLDEYKKALEQTFEEMCIRDSVDCHRYCYHRKNPIKTHQQFRTTLITDNGLENLSTSIFAMLTK